MVCFGKLWGKGVGARCSRIFNLFTIFIWLSIIINVLQLKQEIFKNFQATTGTNRFNPPLSPSLDSTYKHPWRIS